MLIECDIRLNWCMWYRAHKPLRNPKSEIRNRHHPLANAGGSDLRVCAQEVDRLIPVCCFTMPFKFLILEADLVRSTNTMAINFNLDMNDEDLWQGVVN